MAREVLTPITQALNDGTLTRNELKTLMQRSNGPALRHLAIWILALCFTGLLIWASMGTYWVWPAMFLHGVIIVHHFSLQHECVHYTVFKTRWMNTLVGNICGLIIVVPHQYFRYEHCDHHTYTQIHGHDPELIELPQSLAAYIWYLSSIPYWYVKLKAIFRNAMGSLNEVEKQFTPKEMHSTLIWEARITLLLYVVIAVISVATGWPGALWFWVIPLFLGEPLMRFVRMTEHVGKPPVRSMKENTRTNYVSRPMQFLCWNMNYHCEHHYASSVPFHALPKLHEKLVSVVSVEPRGYLGAHMDILTQLLGRKQRADVVKEEL